MGKKGGSKKKGDDEMSDEESSNSQGVLGKLSEALDEITNKRMATRVAALKTIHSALATSVQPEFVVTNRETLLYPLANCLKKGSGDEVEAACKVLMMIAFVDGESCQEIFTTFWPTLKVLITNPSKPTDVRANAMRTASLLTYSSLQPSEVLDCLEVYQNLAEEGVNNLEETSEDKEQIISQALESYGLLTCAIPTKSWDACRIQHLPSCVELLQHCSQDVRLRAGENLAMLCNVVDGKNEEAFLEQGTSAAYSQEGDEENGEVEEEEAGNANSSNALQVASQWGLESADLEVLQANELERISNMLGINMEEIMETMNALMSESSKRKAKKDKAEQRSTFREYLRALEDSSVPFQVLQVKQSKLKFVGWQMLKPLAAVRYFLGSGVQLHLEQSEFLAETLQVDDILSNAVSSTSRHAGDRQRSKREIQRAQQSKAKDDYQKKQNDRKKKVLARNADMGEEGY